MVPEKSSVMYCKLKRDWLGVMLKHFSQLVSTPVPSLLLVDSKTIFNLDGVIKMFWKLMNYKY